MKKTTLKYVFVACLIFSGLVSVAQRGHKSNGKAVQHKHPHKHHRHSKRVVVKRSAYRPAKVIVYHPAWRPHYTYHRRWVYFPGYNLYWDNWRNHYMFWNGTMWISQSARPAVIVNVNLENEKHKELNEEEDDVDDIYTENSKHKEEKDPLKKESDKTDDVYKDK